MNEDDDFFSEVHLYEQADRHLSATDDQFSEDDTLTGEPLRYDAVEEIGKGGVKKIFNVYDRDLCRNVALARLREDVPRSMRDIFLNEARLTAQLDHSNIIKVHDIREDVDGGVYFTMDLKTGHSLKDLIDQRVDPEKPLDEETMQELLDIYIRVCDAVAYAHSKDIIHLDLKPENVQIGRYGDVTLCDWGLGTSLKKIDIEDVAENLFFRHLMLTKPTDERITGTPGYMAPEQLEPKRRKDQRTDVFGLGALLYTMLKGKPPLLGQLSMEDDGAESIPPLSSTERVIPESLEAIAKKAMEENPGERYDSVDDLIYDVRRYVNGYTAVAENAGFIKELNHFLRRNKTLCAVIGGAGLALFILTWVFIYHLDQSRKEEQRARVASENALKLFTNERSARVELSEELLEFLVKQNQSINGVYFFSEPQRSIFNGHQTMEAMLETNPGNPFALREKAMLFVLGTRFDEAHAIYEALTQDEDPESRALAQIAEMFHDKEGYYRTDATVPIGVGKFAEVIAWIRERFPKQRVLTSRMLIYDYRSRENHSGYDQVIREMIHYFNPNWGQQVFGYDRAKQHLKIGGVRVRQLSHYNGHGHKSFLAYIPIQSLDVSGLNVRGIDDLRGMTQLKKLNISKTPIPEVPTVEDFPMLQELIISRQQFSPQQLERVAESVKVVYADE